MVDMARLLKRVEHTYLAAPDRPAPWSDPHRNREPDDDEYSRVTDAQKWRIVGVRADAWIDALVSAGVATVEADPTIDWTTPFGAAISRTDLVRPHVFGGLPLVVARTRLGTLDDAGVMIGVGEPTVVLAPIPDCGCDACDSGSQNEVELVDEHFTGVVTGQFRQLTKGRAAITRVSEASGTSSRGLRGHHKRVRILEKPKGWTELSGPSWLA
jgi:hypothetical protein